MTCRFCGGAGCLSCDTIKPKKKEDERLNPIFTAQRDNPDDMEALAKIAGRSALEHAYGPDGGGMAEIKYNACVESLIQKMRNSFVKGD